MILFISVFLFIYALINGYIALRTWSALSPSFPRSGIVLTFFIILSAFMFPLTRWLEGILPYHIVRPFYIWGVYWLGIMYYAFLFLIFIDIMRLIKHFFPHFILFQVPAAGLAGLVIAVILGLMIYGTWNARHPIINEYHLTLAKKNSQLDALRVVMVSDLHLGWVYRGSELQNLVQRVNGLQPDIVFFAGDIVDEGIDISLEQVIPFYLNDITAPLGIYAVLGNHEYISGQQDQFTLWLEQAGIHVLRDSWMEMNLGLYVVGRDDASHGRSSGNRRLSLEALLSKIDVRQLPVILLDHQPSELEIAGYTDVDLQLSGHTHLGQFFPNNLVTGKIFAQDWGYYQQGTFQAIVSSGYGTWGPPIRIGNHPELVVINITFTQ